MIQVTFTGETAAEIRSQVEDFLSLAPAAPTQPEPGKSEADVEAEEKAKQRAQAAADRRKAKAATEAKAKAEAEAKAKAEAEAKAKAEAEAKAKAEELAAKVKTAKVEDLDYESDVKPLLAKVAAMPEGADAVKKLIASYGVRKGSDIPADKLADAKVKGEEILASLQTEGDQDEDSFEL